MIKYICPSERYFDHVFGELRIHFLVSDSDSVVIMLVATSFKNGICLIPVVIAPTTLLKLISGRCSATFS